MLLITAREGDCVLIGQHSILRVVRINPDTYAVGISYTRAVGKLKEFTLKPGSPVQIDTSVNVVSTRVNEGRHITVTLGFDAPRRIPIRGEWSKKLKDKTPYSELMEMSPRQLLKVAEKEKQTDLEKALMKHLKEGIEK